jgi:hypothetical protein
MDGLGVEERGKRGSSVFVPPGNAYEHWIPAFAGMTKNVGFAL